MTYSSRVLIAGMMVVAAGGGGCATIVNGSSQSVTIQSEPSGATVTVPGVGSFITPATVKLERGKEHLITFSKPGYGEKSVTLKRNLSGWAFGNLLFGGLIGVIVDAATGNWYYFDPEAFSVDLKSGSMIEIKGDEAKKIREASAPAPVKSKE